MYITLGARSIKIIFEEKATSRYEMTSEKPVLESMNSSQIEGGDECVTF
jgi:hypothetical protein